MEQNNSNQCKPRSKIQEILLRRWAQELIPDSESLRKELFIQFLDRLLEN